MWSKCFCGTSYSDFVFLLSHLLVLQKVYLGQKAWFFFFWLLSAQETRAGSVSTFRSVVLCLRLICKCNRTQCKGHTWRSHICLFVPEKHQLCWGGLRVVIVMTLKQFWGATFHVWTMLPQSLFYWGARNSSSVPIDIHTGRCSFPQLAELWDWLPFLSFMDLLLFSIEWDRICTTLLKKKEIWMQLLYSQLWIGELVRTAVLYFSKIRKRRDEQQ